MAITKEQKEQRRKFIGSSDIAALFSDENGHSLDPFKVAADVWAEKCFEFEEKESTKAQSIGHRYESALIEYAEHELGWFIETKPAKIRFICEKYPIFACNLDGFIPGDEIATPPILPEIVEAKTTGLADEYGEPGTDDVPLRVILQVQHQMLCTGWNKAHIVVLLGKFGLREEMYVVERNEEIIRAIIERGTQFWNDYVLNKKAPPDAEPGNIQLFKKIIRTPEKYATVDSLLIEKWEQTKKERLDKEKEEKGFFAQILAQLGDAEASPINEERELTYFLQKGRDIVDTKRLENEYPDIYKKLARENHYRVARIRKI